MSLYHKIHSLYKRSPDGKQMLFGDYSLPEFAYLAETEWVWTEKVDGTNVRVIWNGETVRFGGKTNNAQMPVPLLEALIALFPALMLRDTFKLAASGETQVVLYGEGYGPKIQSGGKYRDTPGFVLFDIRVGRWWLRREDVESIGLQLGVDYVPIVGRGTLPDLEAFVKHGFRSRWGDFTAEGVVARPAVELCTRSGERLVTKLKTKDFPQ